MFLYSSSGQRKPVTLLDCNFALTLSKEAAVTIIVVKRVSEWKETVKSNPDLWRRIIFFFFSNKNKVSL